MADEELNPYEAPSARVDPAADGGSFFTNRRQLASRGSRLLAAIIDSLVFLPIVPIILIIDGLTGDFGILGLFAVGIYAIGILGLNLYWLADNGQTIGKRAMDIKIVRSDRTSEATLARIIFARALPRSILSSIPCVGNIFALADPLFIFRDDRRCIHDHIADTTVVDAPTEYGGAEYAGELEEPSFESTPATEATDSDREPAPSEIEW